ncbi:MAG TPA: cytochrome c [Methylomirabilota bacterium]|jgi:mono/diheme cytochrome c family protein
MRYSTAAGLLLVALAATTVFAADKTIPMPPDHAYAALKPGAGVDVARQQCASCHSTDYIVMQPRSAKQWEGVVTKMIKVFGAPVNDQDAKTIAEYLATQYGN